MKKAPLLLGALLMAGCTTTALYTVTRAPDFKNDSIRRVLIVSLSKDAEHRRIIEEEFVRQWQVHGVTGVASYFALPPETSLDKAHVAPLAKSQGFDTVLVSRLVGRGKIDPQIPEWDTPAHLSPQERTLTKDYPVLVADPGYTPTYQQAVVITSLYRVADGKRVWSATSQTLVTESYPKLIASYVKEVLSKLYA